MLSESQFAMIPETAREMIAEHISATTGGRAIGDGKILDVLSKLFALFLQFAPLFMDGDEAERKIGDGTILNAFLSFLSNSTFQELIAALIAKWTATTEDVS